MAEVYEIAMRIALTGGIASALSSIATQLTGLERLQGKINQGFSNMNRAVVGTAAIIGGTAVLGGLYKLSEAGDELLDQMDKLQRANVSLNDVLRLQKNYYDNVARAVPTSTVSEYLKAFNELRSVVGAEKAEEITPWSMKVEALIANATGKSAEGEGFKLWRAIEMTGRNISDPAGSQKLADALVKDIIGAGGKLDAGTFQDMARRAGVAWANADPRFLAGPMAVVAADLGGPTAGTALMSAYQFLTGATTLSKQQYEVMAAAGLIDPKKVKHTGFGGGTIQLQPGAIRGSGEYLGKEHFDLYGWVQNVVAPALEKLSGGDPAKLAGLIAKLGRNRNVTRMLTMFADPSFVEAIQKDLSQWDQAHGVDQSYDEAMQRNPKFVKEGFWDQFKTMMESIGGPLGQAAIPVMKSITSVFTSIGGIANAHPEAVKLIGEAIAGFGVALLAIGGIALASLISLPVAIVGVASAFAALIAINWDGIKSALSGFVDTIKNFISKLLSLIGGMFHHTNFEGGGSLAPLQRTAAATMGGGSRTIVFTTALNIDGRTLAESVIQAAAYIYENSPISPAANGAAYLDINGGFTAT